MTNNGLYTLQYAIVRLRSKTILRVFQREDGDYRNLDKHQPYIGKGYQVCDFCESDKETLRGIPERKCSGKGAAPLKQAARRLLLGRQYHVEQNVECKDSSGLNLSCKLYRRESI
ncbi:hypothetical protein PPYR_06295 [Photinus pyralis]|uniref:Uncharacterized protein n=1 Tax=Photinus pyralis TaxID=7054 RepID=A0A5N4AT58_PHOPY|nr:hypothetical protein PPYR_06295 [Photinus pyralis]